MPSYLVDITRQVSYTYDATGNRIGMTTDQGTTSYKYDAAGRLLQEDGPSGKIANQYDPAGRLTAQQNGAEQIAYTYNGADQLTSARYNDQTQVTYGYDALGRTALRTENLWELPGEQGQGRGKGKGLGAEKLHQKTFTTRYSFDELTNTIAKEYTGQGGPVLQYYSANDEVIAAKHFGLKDQIVPGREPDLKTTGGLMYYQTDARRTVTEITDRVGGVVDRYRYDAFGGLFTGITAPYNTMGLTGHQYDAKTGLVDMNARWYAPTTGRFLTPDSWPGTVTEPSTQNPYVYVGDNPMTNWDPSGHCPDPMGVSYCADDSGGNTATYYFLEVKGSSSSYQTIKTWRDLQGSYEQYAWSELDWWKYEVMDVTWTDRSKGQGSWTTSDQIFSQVAAGSGVSFTPYSNPQQKEAAAGPARNSAAGPLPKEVIAEQKLVYQSWNPGVVQVTETSTIGGSSAASILVEGFVNKALLSGKTISSDASVQKDISQFEAEKGIPKGILDGGSAAQILAAYAAGVSSVRSKIDAMPMSGPLLACRGPGNWTFSLFHPSTWSICDGIDWSTPFPETVNIFGPGMMSDLQEGGLTGTIRYLNMLVAMHEGEPPSTAANALGKTLDQFAADIAIAEMLAPVLATLSAQGQLPPIGGGQSVETVRVGRWMSEAEYQQMVQTGKVVQSVNGGKTYVTLPSNPDAFKAAAPGSVFVEFDVSADSLVGAGKAEWAQIPGPGSVYDRLLQRAGKPPITDMPAATNITKITTKE